MADMFGSIFEELFSPGRKHTQDERNRLLVTRDEEGQGGPGKGPIDLDSGVVVMVRGPAEDDTADGAPQDGAGGDAGDPG